VKPKQSGTAQTSAPPIAFGGVNAGKTAPKDLHGGNRGRFVQDAVELQFATRNAYVWRRLNAYAHAVPRDAIYGDDDVLTNDELLAFLPT
jgi:hypothetical protein